MRSDLQSPEMGDSADLRILVERFFSAIRGLPKLGQRHFVRCTSGLPLQHSLVVVGFPGDARLFFYRALQSYDDST